MTGPRVALTKHMTLARPVHKMASLMITKRVHRREFRLRPCKSINEIVRYVVAVIGQRTGVQLHCITAMSNHWHICLTDPEGRICDFTRDCHSLIARAVNAIHGDFESQWSREQTSHVHCVEPDDLVGKIAYAMANPVAAGLVAHGKNWPGVRTAWPAQPRVVRKPKQFFRGTKDGGKWPETAVLELSRPPGYEEMSNDDLECLIAEAICEREERARQHVRQEGRRFLGRRGVRKQSRYARPTTPPRRFQASPRIACKSKWRRIECLRRNRTWTDEYCKALAQWRSGDRQAIFPHGTYLMRVRHGAECALPPLMPISPAVISY